VRRVAAGLRALGIKREERVLLLMLDSNDWPVAFWARCTPAWCRWR
jgi:benzoate-CoA ligase